MRTIDYFRLMQCRDRLYRSKSERALELIRIINEKLKLENYD